MLEHAQTEEGRACEETNTECQSVRTPPSASGGLPALRSEDAMARVLYERSLPQMVAMELGASAPAMLLAELTILATL